MYILFTDVLDDRIKNFEKIPFAEAVKLTNDIEKSNREEKKVFSSEFRVLDEEDSIYYRGIFDFGSYNYQNIYHQIHDRVNQIKVDKKNQADKMYLLEQIEKLTPEELKREEKIDTALINLDKSKISKLKRWQRRTAYTLASVSLVALCVTGGFFTIVKGEYEKELRKVSQQNKNHESLIKNYENALLEHDGTALVKFLEKKKDITNPQKRILAAFYLEKNEFEKAVTLLEDPVHVETLILTSNLPVNERMEKIKAFNELYPTNEARYDLAYLSGDFELMLNLPNINMTIERSEMKTYALLKLDKLDEAKTELNNNNNKKLKQTITLYEGLKAEIKTLEEKYKQLTDENKSDEAKEVESTLTKKIEEINAL